MFESVTCEPFVFIVNNETHYFVNDVVARNVWKHMTCNDVIMLGLAHSDSNVLDTCQNEVTKSSP